MMQNRTSQGASLWQKDSESSVCWLAGVDALMGGLGQYNNNPENAICLTIAIVVMQMFTHVQISKIILYHHIPPTVSAQKKYSS